MTKRMRRQQPRVNDPTPAVPWTWRDVTVAFVCFFYVPYVVDLIGRSVTNDAGIVLLPGTYTRGLLGAALPLLWIRRRYNLCKEALGLRRGILRPIASIALGLACALVYYLVVRVWIFGTPLTITAAPSYHVVLFAIVSPSGLASIVLTPFSEEVMDRGYLYAYLRQILGRGPALLLQAVLFSALHLESWWYGLPAAIDAFLAGLMFGLLYEKTGSLYPAIACHGTINCLAILRGAL